MKNSKLRQLIKEVLLKEINTIQYKGKTYYTENPEGKSSLFAFVDKDLKQVAKVNGKTLKFNTKDLEDKLIKEVSDNKTNVYDYLPIIQEKFKDEFYPKLNNLKIYDTQTSRFPTVWWSRGDSNNFPSIEVREVMNFLNQIFTQLRLNIKASPSKAYPLIIRDKIKESLNPKMRMSLPKYREIVMKNLGDKYDEYWEDKIVDLYIKGIDPEIAHDYTEPKGGTKSSQF